MRILFLADVFGAAGRAAPSRSACPSLREELGVDFCVVNGENAADGRGLTPKLADRLLAAGADVVTLGNHVWARDELGPYLARLGARDPAGERRLAARRAGRWPSPPRRTGRPSP